MKSNIIEYFFVCKNCKKVNIDDEIECEKCGGKRYQGLYQYIMKKEWISLGLVFFAVLLANVFLLKNLSDLQMRWLVFGGTLLFLLIYFLYIRKTIKKRISEKMYLKIVNEKDLYRNYFKSIDKIINLNKRDREKYEKLFRISQFYNSDYIREKKLELLSLQKMKRFYGYEFEAESLIVKKENNRLFTYLGELAYRENNSIGRGTVAYFLEYFDHIIKLKDGNKYCAKVLYAGIDFNDNASEYFEKLTEVKDLLAEVEKKCVDAAIGSYNANNNLAKVGKKKQKRNGKKLNYVDSLSLQKIEDHYSGLKVNEVNQINLDIRLKSKVN
ncbi:MAG: hypothetical protein ACRCU3_09105 [Eubacteriaceae bacterium]